MNNEKKGLNDIAWEKIFNKYSILDEIDRNGYYEISSKQIKEFREPRLMTKFDHSINLPKVFCKNNLSILPITRGSYIISKFKTYHKFEENNEPIRSVSLPSYIESIDYNNISSEAIALNCAFISSIIYQFMEEEFIIQTISGRMSSGKFTFNIEKINNNLLQNINVDNSQIEIDAGYEGVGSLAIFEAKNYISEDFIIRQLYYPYRTWSNRINKKIRPMFLVYSNGIYHLYEYKFVDHYNYNSIQLINKARFSIEDTTINMEDIEGLVKSIKTIKEPKIPFPQADSFERVINIIELASDEELSKNDITERYAFDKRQADYYINAARYIGLLDEKKYDCGKVYFTNGIGKKLLKFNFKKRQLEYCKLILFHEVFNCVFKKYLNTGYMPSKQQIVDIMEKMRLHNVKSKETYLRRSSTVISWLNWIIGIITE